MQSVEVMVDKGGTLPVAVAAKACLSSLPRLLPTCRRHSPALTDTVRSPHAAPYVASRRGGAPTSGRRLRQAIPGAAPYSAGEELGSSDWGVREVRP